MTTIRLAEHATAHAVMRTVQETFESRDYLWKPLDDARAARPDSSRPGSRPDGTVPGSVESMHAQASEGGRRVGDFAVGVAPRLRVSITVDIERRRVVLNQDTTGVAWLGLGSPLLHLQLASRFRSLSAAARQDLAAAALTHGS